MKKRLTCHSIFLSFFILVSSINVMAQEEMYIVLMAGQSNMAGRGAYSQLAPADTVTYSNILSLNKDSVWVRAKHPLHWDKYEAGVGMGIQFAHQLALKIGGNVKIGLVPCAAGGTSMDQWTNNSWFGYTGNFNLYTNLIKRAKKAAKNGEIIGLIWHQGESDATNTLYPSYQNKMKNLFVKIRTDLNVPNMPIVTGELGTYLATNANCPRWDSINATLNRLKTVLPNYAVASSAGLTANPDNTHFNAASLITFGKRYAAAFYPLISGTTEAKDIYYQPFKVKIAKNSIHVSLSVAIETQIRIYNSEGKLAQSSSINELNNTIPTDTLKGLYLVTIDNKLGSYSLKTIL